MRKNSLLVLVILAFFLSCNNSNSKKEKIVAVEEKEDKPSIIGAWERTSFYNYGEDGKVTDSFASSEENKHIKIFTPSKVMWCRHIASDSTQWFGYGNYKLTDSLLTEVLEFGSKTMSEFISVNPEFVFKYNLDSNKFSQIQVDAEGHPLFAENYVRLE